MRVNPTPTQKQRLLEASAFRCCVCKRPSVGFQFHHIDGDPSNTVDQNLAVLCVEDHDRHHRPGEYESKPRHLELDGKEIMRLKVSWEAFVAEARKPEPNVIATLSVYGTEELIHSLQLVMQWPDQRIEYLRSFHLLDGHLGRLTDEVIEEVGSIGPKVKLVMLNEPLPVEHCPGCKRGLSRTLIPAVVTRLTDPRWAQESLCSIYINPDQPSLAVQFSLGDQHILSGTLHLCQGKFLHYSSENIDDRIPVRQRPSIRTQASNIVRHLLREWSPAKVLIGTGNPDQPEIIPL